MIGILAIASWIFPLLLSPGNGRPISGGDTLPVQATADGFLRVMSGTQRIRVYLDTTYLGITPLDSVRIPAGRHLVRYLPFNMLQWVYTPVVESIECESGRVIERQVSFPRYLYLTSDPFGASVLSGGKLIGATPLWIQLSDAGNLVTLSQNGFQDLTVSLTSDTLLKLQALISPFAGVEGNSSVTSSKNDMPLYITGGSAIILGAASAYFKIRADNLYHDYHSTGNTAALPRIRHNDRLAGITMVLCQVNLIGFAYFLFSR